MISSGPGFSPELTVHVVSGSVTTEEVRDAAVVFLQEAPTRLSFWDFTNADFSGTQVSDLVTLFDALVPYTHRRRGGKTALLFNSTEGYGLGRLGEALAEIRSFPFEFKAFSDRKEARLWLEVEPKDEEDDRSGEGVA
jgi:hypothetical protein